MALTLNNFIGFESGGTEEALAVAGTPNVQEFNVRTGDYSLAMFSADEYDVAIITGGSSDGGGGAYILGFAFRTAGAPGSASVLHEARDDAGALLWSIERQADGDLVARDSVGTQIGSTATDPATNDGAWYYFEVYWEHADPGQFDLHIAGVSEITGTGDLTAGGTITEDAAFYRFTETATLSYNIEDVYCLSGAAGTGDFLGDAEVFRYQNRTNSATPDTGNALDNGSGVWQDAGLTPGVEEALANVPGYVTDAVLSGDIFTDDTASGKHGRHGPHGDTNIDGTIKGAKYLHQMRRGAGSGTTHRKRYGNSVDAESETAITLTTAYQNFFTMSEAAAVVPLSTEHFSVGFSRSTGGRELYCKEIWAFILHVPSAGTTFSRSVSRTGSISASVARGGSTYGRDPSRTGAIVASVVREGSTYKRAPANTLSLSQSVARKEIAVRAPSRSGSISASVARKETAVRAPSRSGSISASVVRTGSTYKRAPSRSGTITASVATVKKIVRAVSRTGSVTASVVRSGSTYLRAVTRSGTITATLSRTGSTFRRAVTRSGTITATVAAVVKLVRVVSRSGTITATVVRLAKYKRAPARTGAVTASVVRVETAARVLSRTGAITASVARTGSIYKRAVSRTGTVSASVVRVVLTVIVRALSRSGTITATVSRAGSTYKRVVSRVGTMTAGVGKVLDEGVAAAASSLLRWVKH